jgi:hypothetical protein
LIRKYCSIIGVAALPTTLLPRRKKKRRDISNYAKGR